MCRGGEWRLRGVAFAGSSGMMHCGWTALRPLLQMLLNDAGKLMLRKYRIVQESTVAALRMLATRRSQGEHGKKSDEQQT